MFSERIIDNLYMIGIGGVSMSSLACFFSERGVPVRGSDAVDSERCAYLRKKGIAVSIGEEEDIWENTVVYTGAIGENHAQLLRAKAAGKRLLSRAELLGIAAGGFPHALAVAGCHGKTSCTCMCAHVFDLAKFGYTAHIGGDDLVFSNYRSTGSMYFITEACEYKKSFLRLSPECSVLLNIDRDHMDCYRSENDLVGCFKAFAQQSNYVIVHAGDRHLKRFSYDCCYGFDEGDVTACDIASSGEKYSFTVKEQGRKTVRIGLNVVGKVHVLNALAAYCAGRFYGISPRTIADGLGAYCGVKRRFEQIGRFRGVNVVSDYAHHPRELEQTLATARRIQDEITVVFQPHTYSRTKDLFDSFAKVLAPFRPIVYQTYAAREPYDEEGSSERLAEAIGAQHVCTPEGLEQALSERRGKLILVLGAGDIDPIMRSLLDWKTV